MANSERETNLGLVSIMIRNDDDIGKYRNTMQRTLYLTALLFMTFDF